ncbi:MAG: Holliday junction branch migration protein RuvA [Bacteroidota bacterium]
MISFLRGTLDSTGPDWLLIDVQGVGYQVQASEQTIQALPQPGQPVRIFTHLVHREDAMLLYGFRTMEEKELFLLLLGVSGIGAKTALSILSAHTPGEIVTAVLEEDANSLVAPGVGKKTAARLVLELKEKLKDRTDLLLGERGETEEALLALGYSLEEIRRLALPSGLPVEDAIRLALERLSEK